MRSFYNGVNTPVFSLKTATSGGIGEYLDLIPLIEWARARRLNVVQILPVNDTGLDTSPYNLRSAFALNPLLIKWPGLHDKGLNKLVHIDYEAVRELKLKAYKNYPFSFKEVEAFRKKEKWVETYAHLYEGEKSLCEQWLASVQLRQVKAYAEKLGVKIMGDLPILVARDSVDVTLHPHLFHLERSAGAPADGFADEDQNWGFPTYNWNAMKDEDFLWWKQRLRNAEQYYHLYRLDHIVGFYRIYTFSVSDPELPGEFRPKDKSIWIPHGEEILMSLIDSSNMEPIGEDLGTVPACVTDSMKKLLIPGTRVLRWERRKEPPCAFIPFNKYPPLNLATVSTHDAAPLRLWWQTHPEEKEAWCKFMNWRETKILSDEKIKEILSISHHTPCLYAVNLLLEYLSAVPSLRWHNPEEDRINVPGTVSDKNWCWRMRPSIEEMAASKEFSRLFQEILY